MEFACSEAIPFKGRNKEYAMHVLQLVEYNIKVNTIYNVLEDSKIYSQSQET